MRSQRLGTCSVDGCDRLDHAKGLCAMHYNRLRLTGRVGPAESTRHRQAETCLRESCDRRPLAKGLCPLHYNQVRYPLDGTRRRKGEGGEDGNGYRRIWVDGRNVKEHRHVMEVALGRTLMAHENVHHINGVRNDNRPENLELWVTKQPRGQRVPDLVEWAVAILEQYAPDLLADRPAQLRIVN